MAALQDRSERPSGAANLQQQEALQYRTAEALTHGIGRDQQYCAGQPYEHSDNRRAMQSRAARNQRFDTDHPERRYGNKHRSQAARHPLFSVNQTARASANDDDAVERCVPEFASAGKVRFHKIRDRQQDDSGNGIAQGHQYRWQHGFERDPDAQVRGAPEETHRGQRHVSLKMGMARQNSG